MRPWSDNYCLLIVQRDTIEDGQQQIKPFNSALWVDFSPSKDTCWTEPVKDTEMFHRPAANQAIVDYTSLCVSCMEGKL